MLEFIGGICVGVFGVGVAVAAWCVLLAWAMTDYMNEGRK